MSDTELAYTAGLIDGEGYLSIRKNAASFQPLVGVAMTSIGVIGWLAKTYGGRLLKVHRSDTEHKEDTFRWELSAKPDVLLFLQGISPYLIVKRVHALVVMDFCQKFPSTSHGFRYTKADREAMALYYRVMAVANVKGPGSNDIKLKLFEAIAPEGAKCQ